MNLIEIANKTYSADPEDFVTAWAEIIGDYEDHPDLKKETIRNLQAAKAAGVSPRALGANMIELINNSEWWSLKNIAFTNKAGKRVFGVQLINLNKIELNDDDDDWDW